MYLKSIEIQGFKSFANRILFEFHNGITGIVGPNGSGKSNVADAVRWVLGEQRIRQLRGGTMQDVIFAGTQLRRPQGFAYVAITLDNSDHQLPISFDEVTISRRLYRSGESEYKINGSACRLKDINELFYDTGIGKEGYSIIGQGQIDRILSGRPEEKRELFDEAAGIVKFKRRKAVAQKKLEDESQNLVRVTDILSELEKQVGPLEKQAASAREYLRLKEELKTYDVNLFLTESGELERQLAEIEKKAEIVAGDRDGVIRESETLKETYDALGRESEELEASIAGRREALGRYGISRQALEGRIGVLREQIKTEQLNEEHVKSRLADIVGELEEKKARLSAYEEEREALEQEIGGVAAQLSEAGQKLKDADAAISGSETRIGDAKEAIIAALNEKAELAARRQRYETMLEQANVRQAEVSRRLLKFRSDESAQEEELKKEQEELARIRGALSRYGKCEQELEEEDRRLQEEIRRLNRRLNDAQQEYHTSRTRLESLRNLAERYEGYGGSIRRVMEARDRIHGVHGVVADLITTAREYETALETALGGSIQNVVTDSEQTAKRLIEYLKKNRYGRATFLPLDSIGSKGGFSQTAALAEPGVLGLASSLVTADPQYAGLIEYLLGRVVVVDQIDHAIALAGKYRHSLRIVTLDGELLSPGGSMTGGAFKNSSNLLGRKREIEELKEACQKAIRKAEAVQQELAADERVQEEGKRELAQIKEQQKAAYLEENTKELHIRQAEERCGEIRASYRELEEESRELSGQSGELRDRKEELAAQAGRLEEESGEKSRQIEEENGRLETLRRERETLAKTLSEVQLKAAALRQKEQFNRENRSRLQEEEARLKEERERLTEGQSGSGERIAAREDEIRALTEQIGREAEEAAALEEAMKAEQADREKKAARQKEFFEQREALSGRLALLDREEFRLQSQKERLSERLEAQASYMWSEYELTRSTAAALREESLTSVPAMKKEIESLKGRIRALGNVNVNAIEDYREVSERYAFLKTQHEDLTAAREALVRIIGELDAGMRRQFHEKFAEIRQEFDKVFRELFGGGNGTLELSADEDILEAGIQIIAQPPGKKLQNMMQLSGGEKALTAIALLFAIQNLKPSPFCLLDEIEAALDDSNVDRFAGYLHKLTKHTQFIVITHRRGTMVASDRLYGITMQEKGVSTLVSVSLIEAELEQEEKKRAAAQ